MRPVVQLILGLARRLLPPSMHRWGEAAFREAGSIGHPGEALIFALGCLGWATREAVRFQFAPPQGQEDPPMTLIDSLRGPRGTAVLCAVGATGLGLAWMAAAGAPVRYLMINAAALAFGLVALAILTLADRRGHLAAGPLNLMLGAVLVAVSLWGVTAEGVTRWVALGPLIIQPALMIVPLMAVLFARSRDVLSLAGIGLAALGLALQPDRAMAGALAAGLTVLAVTRPNRAVLAAVVVAALGFVATLIRPDRSPAMPFVDQILYSSFSVHPLAGAAVLLGSALLLLPALSAVRSEAPERSAGLAFGAVWAAIVAAAALGNYPTPLVGYGGSAIIGYLLGVVVFPRRAAQPRPFTTETPAEPEQDRPALCVGGA